MPDDTQEERRRRHIESLNAEASRIFGQFYNPTAYPSSGIAPPAQQPMQPPPGLSTAMPQAGPDPAWMAPGERFAEELSGAAMDVAGSAGEFLYGPALAARGAIGIQPEGMGRSEAIETGIRGLGAPLRLAHQVLTGEEPADDLDAGQQAGFESAVSGAVKVLSPDSSIGDRLFGLGQTGLEIAHMVSSPSQVARGIAGPVRAVLRAPKYDPTELRAGLRGRGPKRSVHQPPATQDEIRSLFDRTHEELRGERDSKALADHFGSLLDEEVKQDFEKLYSKYGNSRKSQKMLIEAYNNRVVPRRVTAEPTPTVDPQVQAQNTPDVGDSPELEAQLREVAEMKQQGMSPEDIAAKMGLAEPSRPARPRQTKPVETEMGQPAAGGSTPQDAAALEAEAARAEAAKGLKEPSELYNETKESLESEEIGDAAALKIQRSQERSFSKVRSRPYADDPAAKPGFYPAAAQPVQTELGVPVASPTGKTSKPIQGMATTLGREQQGVLNPRPAQTPEEVMLHGERPAGPITPPTRPYVEDKPKIRKPKSEMPVPPTAFEQFTGPPADTRKPAPPVGFIMGGGKVGAFGPNKPPGVPLDLFEPVENAPKATVTAPVTRTKLGREAGRAAFRSARTEAAEYGPEVEQAVKLTELAEQQGDVAAGTALSHGIPKMKDLTDTELESAAKLYTQGVRSTNPKVAAAQKAWQDLSETVAGWAKMLFKVGDEPWVGLDPKKYFPSIAKAEYKTANPPGEFLKDLIIENPNLKLKDVDEAREFWVEHMNLMEQDFDLNAITKGRVQGSTSRFGPLEMHRNVKLPDYAREWNLRKMYEWYAEHATRRITQAAYLGQKNERLTELFAKANKRWGELGRFSEDLTSFIEATYGTRRHWISDKLKRTGMGVMGPLTGALNPLDIIGKVPLTVGLGTRGVKAMWRSGVRAVTGKGIGHQANADHFEKFAREIGLPDGSGKTMYDRYLNATLYKQSEKGVRSVLANVGLEDAKELFAKLKKDPANKKLRSELGRYLPDVDKTLERGHMTKLDEAMAGRRAYGLTQPASRFDLPAYWRSPTGSALTQLKSWGFKSAAALKDGFKQDKTRFFAGLAGFIAAGMTREEFLDWMRGRSEDKHIVRRLINGLGQGGGFGLAFDALMSMKYGRSLGLMGFLSPPAVTQAVKQIDNAWAAAKSEDRDFASSALKEFGKYFGGTRPIVNMLGEPPKEYPYKAPPFIEEWFVEPVLGESVTRKKKLEDSIKRYRSMKAKRNRQMSGVPSE